MRKSNSKVEVVVQDFYENYGWVKVDGQSGEDESFRQFRQFYYDFYCGVTREREISQFVGLQGNLLLAGGGDLPRSHLQVAEQFDDVTCVDFSQRALDISREKLGDEARYVRESILNLSLEDDSMDAVFCAHVIYHIDRREQVNAIRQLIRVTKPGGRIVIIYSNPRAPLVVFDRLWNYSLWPVRRLKRVLRRDGAGKGNGKREKPRLYFKAFPLGFWKQFDNSCDVELLPWQILRCSQERRFVRSDDFAEKFFRWAARIEEKYPSVAVRFWGYPIVVLSKR